MYYSLSLYLYRAEQRVCLMFQSAPSPTAEEYKMPIEKQMCEGRYSSYLNNKQWLKRLESNSYHHQQQQQQSDRNHVWL